MADKRPTKKADIEYLQRRCNAFTKKYMSGVAALRVDGKWGRHTINRIYTVKYHLGYDRPINLTIDDLFYARIKHPKSTKHGTKYTKSRIATAVKRRLIQRNEYRARVAKAWATPGQTTYDKVPVAKYFVPHLRYARSKGWDGRLVSGVRSGSYSETLCKRMCGAPKCPGKCAGRDSNHIGIKPPRGAIDVSWYDQFGDIIDNSPHKPRIFNDLPSDRVHFSPTGK